MVSLEEKIIECDFYKNLSQEEVDEFWLAIIDKISSVIYEFKNKNINKNLQK